MNLKIKTKQVYEDHFEENEENFKNALINILDNVIKINYNDIEIIYNKIHNIVQIKSKENNIIVSKNKEKELIYNTPYGKLNLKTFGEEITYNENPFGLLIKYKIVLNNSYFYTNIVEISSYNS